jgi:hypothetical protein
MLPLVLSLFVSLLLITTVCLQPLLVLLLFSLSSVSATSTITSDNCGTDCCYCTEHRLYCCGCTQCTKPPYAIITTAVHVSAASLFLPYMHADDCHDVT